MGWEGSAASPSFGIISSGMPLLAGSSLVMAIACSNISAFSSVVDYTAMELSTASFLFPTAIVIVAVAPWWIFLSLQLFLVF